MQETLDRYEKGELSPVEVEESMESNIQALEIIGSKEISRSRELSYQLVRSNFCNEEDGFQDEPKTKDILREYRMFLDNLPC